MYSLKINQYSRPIVILPSSDCSQVVFGAWTIEAVIIFFVLCTVNQNEPESITYLKRDNVIVRINILTITAEILTVSESVSVRFREQSSEVFFTKDVRISTVKDKRIISIDSLEVVVEIFLIIYDTNRNPSSLIDTLLILDCFHGGKK